MIATGQHLLELKVVLSQAHILRQTRPLQPPYTPSQTTIEAKEALRTLVKLQLLVSFGESLRQRLPLVQNEELREKLEKFIHSALAFHLNHNY